MCMNLKEKILKLMCETPKSLCVKPRAFVCETPSECV